MSSDTLVATWSGFIFQHQSRLGSNCWQRARPCGDARHTVRAPSTEPAPSRLESCSPTSVRPVGPLSHNVRATRPCVSPQAQGARLDMVEAVSAELSLHAQAAGQQHSAMMGALAQVRGALGERGAGAGRQAGRPVTWLCIYGRPCTLIKIQSSDI